MRRFSAAYLRETRRGMWDDREALAALNLPEHDRILDVGCGTGAFTEVLREEARGRVVGLDADRSLLAAGGGERVQGDARRLPVRDGSFDLVICQALLVNLLDPRRAISEFVRASSDLVAAVEPDNSAVEVDSTVGDEVRLSRRARETYIQGIPSDVALGSEAARVFEECGLTDIETRRYLHRQRIEPPYSSEAIEGALRKARGDRLTEQRETLLAGGLSGEEFASLRTAWREMGREVIGQMREEEYEREERIPFFVTVGRT